MKNILLPGWGIPIKYYSDYCNTQTEIIDYGLFGRNSLFNFKKPISEIKKICSQPCVIIAHSMGTMLALKAAQISKNVKGLILFSPFARFSQKNPDYPLGQPVKNIDGMRQHLKFNAERLLKSFYRTMTAPERVRMEVPQILNPPALLAGLDFLAAFDCRAELAKIQIPVFIFQGKEDLIVNVGIVLGLAEKIKFSKLYLFNDAGHALPFTHSKKCKKIMLDFPIGQTLQQLTRFSQKKRANI